MCGTGQKCEQVEGWMLWSRCKFSNNANIPLFGPYIKYYVMEIGGHAIKWVFVLSSKPILYILIGHINAFAVLMHSAHQLSCPAVPTTTDDPKNRKQELRNDVIAFLTSKNLKWHGSEVNSSGEAFVGHSVDYWWLSWYIWIEKLYYSFLFQFVCWL